MLQGIALLLQRLVVQHNYFETLCQITVPPVFHPELLTERLVFLLQFLHLFQDLSDFHDVFDVMVHQLDDLHQARLGLRRLLQDALDVPFLLRAVNADEQHQTQKHRRAALLDQLQPEPPLDGLAELVVQVSF